MVGFSRLAKKEEWHSLLRAIKYGLMTIIVILFILVVGVPALIKLAVFLGNLRSSPIPSDSKTVALSPPILNPLPEATNSAQTAVSGVSQSETRVRVFLNDQKVYEATAEKDGTFKTNTINLTHGENELYAVALDSKGNTSQPSKKIHVNFLTDAPDLEIFQPADKSIVRTESNIITISGKTEPDARLYINDHVVIVDNHGEFSYPYSLSLGENTLRIVATDRAGNQTEKIFTITYSPW